MPYPWSPAESFLKVKSFLFMAVHHLFNLFPGVAPTL